MTDYEKLRRDIETLCGTANEDTIAKYWNEYVEKNLATCDGVKIHKMSKEILTFFMGILSYSKFAESMLSENFNAKDRYVYEYEDSLRSTNSIYGVINLVELRDYLYKTKMSDIKGKAKELKAKYNKENVHLLNWADEVADFLDEIIN